MVVELAIPDKLDTVQLAAAVKTSLAAFFNTKVNTVYTTGSRVSLTDGDVTLIEPNAIVRYLLNSTDKEIPALDFEESDLWNYVENLTKLDLAKSEQLAKFLPSEYKSVEAIVLFADLHALSTALGKQAIAAEGSVVLWHQSVLNNSTVKQALMPVFKTEYTKPAKKKQGSNLPVEESKADSSSKSNVKKFEMPKLERDGKVNVDQGVKFPIKEEPILPEKDRKNILITSALPYVNNVPHLGNIIGSVLSADFFARYCKARNYNTLFICGTDEYGTATETKALEVNKSPRDLCTYYYGIHKEVYDWFQVGFDSFGRTSTEEHTKITQEVFLKLYENGYLEEHENEQLYCPSHEGFLADRYVEGECPKCHYNDARGDQCDACGELLDPVELINPHCKLDSGKPEKRKTTHMYLSLNKLQPELEKWVSTVEDQWSRNARHITHHWLKGGLEPRAITRDLKWGVPVPLKGFEGKVMYVWFDAVLGYASITGDYTPEWRQWWKNPENVELFQFMGKDNTPFHAVVLPSTEIGTNDNWTKVSVLSTTEYLQYEGGKFSKSRNLGVFGTNAKDIGLSPSIWRYYLANVRPESSDSQFSWADFVARNNNELLANFGNFVSRVTKFATAKFNGVLPKFDPSVLDKSVFNDVNEILKSYNTAMEKVQLRRGLEIAMQLSAYGNRLLQENKFGNSLLAEQPEVCFAVVGVAVNLIYVLSAVFYPFIPETSEQICKQLNVPLRTIPDRFEIVIGAGHNLGTPEHLFQHIDEKNIAIWQAKYGGNNAE